LGHYNCNAGGIGSAFFSERENNMNRVDATKWVATAIQLVGYGLTGLNIVPWNVFAFFIGIFLWFAVGVMWKDKAIMVVHVGAFISLLFGYLNS
jgi:hypothetical protein